MGALKIPTEKDRLSEHFVWKEALWLPQWKRMANASDGLTQQTLDNLSSFLKRWT